MTNKCTHKKPGSQNRDPDHVIQPTFKERSARLFNPDDTLQDRRAQAFVTLETCPF